MHMENDFHLADRNNMNKDKVTIHDVARAANVSPATVSRVLNNPNYKCSVSGLRDKIWKTAIEMNYVPNEAARNLKRIAV